MAGRPPVNNYDDIDSIQQKIDAYLSGNEEPGFAGLAYALGYSSRTQVWELAKGQHPISEPIKRALLYIESDYEKALRGGHPTGAIFALKNRGWSDKQEVTHDGDIKVQFAFVDGAKKDD